MADGGHRFRMLYVGRANQVQKILTLLECHARPPVLLKSVFPWNLMDYLDHLESKWDLTIMHVSKLLYGYLNPAGFLKIPESVLSILTLAETKEETQVFFSETAQRKVKRVASQGFTWEIRKDKSALQQFYHHIYKPYAIKRFGQFAHVANFYKVRRLFRTGFLVLVSKDGGIVSAAICRVIQKVLWFEMSGLEQGNSDLLDESAGDAIYYSMLEVAHELNCTHINYRNSRPFLNDGALMYKRWWGSRLIDNQKNCREIGTKINLSEKYRYNPFFDNFPIISDRGKLSGLVLLNQDKAVTVRQVQAMKNTFLKPGIMELLIFSLNGFDEEVPEHISKNDSRIRIIDPSNVDTFSFT